MTFIISKGVVMGWKVIGIACFLNIYNTISIFCLTRLFLDTRSINLNYS